MDEALTCARVKVQYGDDEQRIEVKYLSYYDLNSATRVMPITLCRPPTDDLETYRFQLNHALWTASIGWIGRSWQYSSSWSNPSQRKRMAYLEEAGKDLQMFSWLLSPSPSSWNSRLRQNTIKVMIITFTTLQSDWMCYNSLRQYNCSTILLSYTMLSTNRVLLAARATREEETPAQAEARANASRKLKMDRFSRFQNWVKEIFSSNMLSRD